MKKAIFILFLSLAGANLFAQSGSKPLDISMLMVTLQGYQPTNAIGQPNGYAPLGSNALIAPTFLFPSFTGAPDGAFWAKNSNSLSPVSGLSVSSNGILFSRVSVGLVNSSDSGQYGVKIGTNGPSKPLVLSGGASQRVFVANGETFGASTPSYNGFIWSVSGAGVFSFASGAIQGPLSMGGNTISNVGRIYKSGGIDINFTNNQISGSGSPISAVDPVIVPDISLSNIQSGPEFATYALNIGTADQIYPRKDAPNTWSEPQVIASLSLGSPLPVSSGGTGATNQASARAALGLSIGTSVQAYNSRLQSISSLDSAANNDTLVWSGTSLTNRTPQEMRSILSLVPGTNVQAYSQSLQYIASATNAAQNSVLVWSGSSWSTAEPAAARSALGVSIGTNVQAYSQVLAGIADTNNPPSANRFLVGNGSIWVSSAASSARSSLGLGSAATNQSSDFQEKSTNLDTLASNNGVNLTNISFGAIGIVPVDKGGTGADSAGAARTNLGLGGGLTATITNIIGTNTNTITVSNGIITSWTQQ